MIGPNHPHPFSMSPVSLDAITKKKLHCYETIGYQLKVHLLSDILATFVHMSILCGSRSSQAFCFASYQFLDVIIKTSDYDMKS